MNCVKLEKNSRSQDFRMRVGLAVLFVLAVAMVLFYAVVFYVRLKELSREYSKIPTNMSYADSMKLDGYLDQDYWGMAGRDCLGIIDLGTLEMFCVDLKDTEYLGPGYELIQEDVLRLEGRIDTSRRYFDGRIVWKSQDGEGDEAPEICMVNFATGEKMLLEKPLRAFLLGDYYISCHYEEEPGQVELTVFYCPPDFY